MKLPVPHHPFCRESRCSVCLDDHVALERYLAEATDCDPKADWLRRYRQFMDKRLGRSTQTEWGWADPVIFEPEHLEAFIQEWTEPAPLAPKEEK